MPNDTDPDVPASATAEAARALREPVLVPLPELGVIAVSGADAITFLQAQLTNDVAHLAPGQMQLNGYCTAKGRLLATFHQWRHGDDVMLRLPREILPAVMKRLAMFVLRAKVKLADASEAWSTAGVLGPRRRRSRCSATASTCPRRRGRARSTAPCASTACPMRTP